jgi:hypothetical protein
LTGGLLWRHDEPVILIAAMTSIIDQKTYGTSAFVKNAYGMKIVMNAGAPCVEWSFRVVELQQWLTTLEDVMFKEKNNGNRRDLEDIYFSLKAAHSRHLEEHEEVVTDAPTADDLQAYLADYAAAVGGQG